MTRTIQCAALLAMVSACQGLLAQAKAPPAVGGIRIDPVRVARVTVERGVVRLDGEWMPCPLPSDRSGRLAVPAFDCAGLRGGLGPFDPQSQGSAENSCGLPCNPNPGALTILRNPNTIEDMQGIHAAPGGVLSAIYSTFYWGPAAPAPLFLIYIFYEDVLENCPDPGAFTPTGSGIVFGFGPAVPPSAPFNYITFVSDLDSLGMTFPTGDRDGDGYPDGSYQMVIATDVNATGFVLPTFPACSVLWMTGDAADQCRVGFNNAESYDDTSPTDGHFGPSECHDYTSPSCVARFGKANAFFWRRCQADLNADGFVDGIDSDLFANAFEAGECAADFNGDCFVDGIDADRFYNEFESACQ